MSNLVLDASISLAWLLDDEESPIAEAARARLAKDNALVPGIWHLEMRNALLVAERRKRLSPRMADERLDALAILPIHTDNEPSLPGTMALARNCGTSFYDALYLELALRTSAEPRDIGRVSAARRSKGGHTCPDRMIGRGAG